MAGFRFNGCEHPYSVLVCPICNQELCYACGGFRTNPYDPDGEVYARCTCGNVYNYKTSIWQVKNEKTEH